jgi:hypothetical protein
MLMRHGVLLSPVLADIFDLIERRKEGIAPETLTWVLYGVSNRTTQRRLAANIWLLNSRLSATDYSVRAERHRAYRLRKRRS